MIFVDVYNLVNLIPWKFVNKNFTVIGQGNLNAMHRRKSQHANHGSREKDALVFETARRYLEFTNDKHPCTEYFRGQFRVTGQGCCVPVWWL